MGLAICFLFCFSFAQTCEELGFSEDLLCSDCDNLQKFVKEQKLIEECQSCCVEDSDVLQSKFDSAVLVVSRSTIENREVHIAKFIKEELEAFPKVSVRYMPGAISTLQLYKGDTVADSLRISQWSSVELREFLQSKVK